MVKDKLISSQMVINILENIDCSDGVGLSALKCDIINDAIIAIKALPSTEVGRCKYCQHSIEWYGDKRKCFLWCEDGIDVFEDGYCNYWE